jgi:dTDP-4-amino-4,6-dideoxygalactose transaminase
MELPKAKFELEFSHGSTYGDEEKAAVLDVLKASAPSCGVKVQQFEREFAGYCGTKYGLAVSSATAGLSLALIAAGVGPGDEVITTPNSWISTANAAAALGAKVVFADIDSETLNLDPGSVATKITDRTKVILPVHL